MSELRTKFATFVDTFVPGRAKPSDTHTDVDVSWNGTASMPSGALEEALFRRFKEMHDADAPRSERVEEPIANE